MRHSSFGLAISCTSCLVGSVYVENFLQRSLRYVSLTISQGRVQTLAFSASQQGGIWTISSLLTHGCKNNQQITQKNVECKDQTFLNCQMWKYQPIRSVSADICGVAAHVATIIGILWRYRCVSACIDRYLSAYAWDDETATQMGSEAPLSS